MTTTDPSVPSGLRFSRPAHGWTDPRTWVPLTVLLAAYVVVQWAVLQPPHWGDSLRVFDYATTWPDVEPDHHALRVGTLWLVMLAQDVLGYGQGSYYVVAFLGGLTLIAGTFLVARELFGEVLAVVAAGTMLVSPYVVDSELFLTAGLVLPDVPAAGTFALGIALMLVALRAEDDQPARTLLVIAGLLLGWSYLIREFVPAMYLVLPVAFVAWRVPLRRMLWMLVPMLGVLAIELLVNGIVHGDPFIRLTIAGEHGGVREDPVTVRETLGRALQAFRHGARGLLLLVLAVLNLLGAIVLRDRRLVLTLTWTASLTVALLALGGLLDPASPSLRIELTRYWFPVFPAIVIGGLGTVALTMQAVAARWHVGWATALAAAVLVWIGLTVALPAARQVWNHPRDEAWAGLRTWLASEQAQRFRTIWTDSRSDRMLEVYRHEVWGGEEVWEGRIREFSHRDETPPFDEIGRAPIVYAPQGPTVPPSDEDGRILYRSEDASVLVLLPQRR